MKYDIIVPIKKGEFIMIKNRFSFKRCIEKEAIYV